MEPGKIQDEIEGMSEYEAKMVLCLMAVFGMPYEEAKERANKMYDGVFKWERKNGKSG